MLSPSSHTSSPEGHLRRNQYRRAMDQYRSWMTFSLSFLILGRYTAYHLSDGGPFSVRLHMISADWAECVISQNSVYLNTGKSAPATVERHDSLEIGSFPRRVDGRCSLLSNTVGPTAGRVSATVFGGNLSRWPPMSADRNALQYLPRVSSSRCSISLGRPSPGPFDPSLYLPISQACTLTKGRTPPGDKRQSGPMG